MLLESLTVFSVNWQEHDGKIVFPNDFTELVNNPDKPQTWKIQVLHYSHILCYLDRHHIFLPYADFLQTSQTALNPCLTHEPMVQHYCHGLWSVGCGMKNPILYLYLTAACVLPSSRLQH